MWSKLDAANAICSRLGKQAELVVLPKLNEHKEVLTASLKDSVIKRWQEIISVTSEGERSVLRVQKDIGGNTSFDLIDEDLHVVISNLKTFKLLESKVTEISNLLAELFLPQILSGSHSIIIEETITMTRKEDLPQTTEAIFRYLAEFATFLSTTLVDPVLTMLISTLIPGLITDILTSLLPSRIPAEISGLSDFDTLLDAVAYFETHLVNLGWTSETALTMWLADAPSVWFSSRQAVFLMEARVLVSRECRNLESAIISGGIDIMVEPQRLQSKSVETEKAIPRNVPEKPPSIRNEEIEEEETDGWGFDDADEEVEESIDTAAGEDDVEPDAWNWEDDDADIGNNQVADTNSFPYSLSTIPEPLMELVERVLKEGEELKSPRFTRIMSDLIPVIQCMLY